MNRDAVKMLAWAPRLRLPVWSWFVLALFVGLLLGMGVAAATTPAATAQCANYHDVADRMVVLQNKAWVALSDAMEAERAGDPVAAEAHLAAFYDATAQVNNELPRYERVHELCERDLG